MVWPSGDQRGVSSMRGPEVNWLGAPPSVVTVQTWDVAGIVEVLWGLEMTKATSAPSGVICASVTDVKLTTSSGVRGLRSAMVYLRGSHP